MKSQVPPALLLILMPMAWAACDTDYDGSIITTELVSCIDHWKIGSVSLHNVMEAIHIWKFPTEICDDGLDNDDDGDSDCDDDDCTDSPSCCKEVGETCEVGECCIGLGCYQDRCAVGDSIDPMNHPENQWIKQTPTYERVASEFEYEGAGAFDPYNLVWIHEGGHDAYGTPQAFALWTWDIKTGNWTIQFPNDGPPGSCVVMGSGKFDLANKRYVKTVGAFLSHGYQWIRSINLRGKYIWLYDVDNNEWIDPLPPPYDQENIAFYGMGRNGLSRAYDSKHQISVNFGGRAYDSTYNNIFYYDAYDNKVVQMNAENPPSKRTGAGFSYDSKRDMFVLFGGMYSEDNKTWIYKFSTNQWESYELHPSPSTRNSGYHTNNPRIAYDSINDIHLAVVYVGNVTGSPRIGSLETWAFYPEELRWENLTKNDLDLTIDRSRNLDFIPELNLFMLESKYVGEQQGDANINQLWTYRYADATPAYLNRVQPPQNPIAETMSNSVTLRWNPSETQGIQSYKVYRAQGEVNNLEFVEIAETSELEYTDSDVGTGQIYFYRMTAIAGSESEPSLFVRTQPRFMNKPVVSVIDTGNIRIGWESHHSSDIAGYNLYRGLVKVHTSTTIDGKYPEGTKQEEGIYEDYTSPVVEMVRNIVNIEKLNADLVSGTTYIHSDVDLLDVPPESEDYKYAVYAYIIKAVNNLGVESGPSPYALTIPSAPQHVLMNSGVLKWDANPEQEIVGYYIYKYQYLEPVIRYPPELVTTTSYDIGQDHRTIDRFWVVPVDSLGQEGIPSVPVWYGDHYAGFYEGEWHQ